MYSIYEINYYKDTFSILIFIVTGSILVRILDKRHSTYQTVLQEYARNTPSKIFVKNCACKQSNMSSDPSSGTKVFF